MTGFRISFRVFLMAIAISLFTVTVWNRVSNYFNEIPVNLPQVSSETPLYVFPVDCGHVLICGSGYGGGYSQEILPSERDTRIVQDRDMNLYDLGGSADTCAYIEAIEKQCQSKRDWARLFIFEHWKEKKRGYISVGYRCTDCSPTDHFFIEPDGNGEWRIAIRFETNDGIHRLPTAFGIKFRRPTKEERERESPTRVLSLLDENGKEIRAF